MGDYSPVPSNVGRPSATRRRKFIWLAAVLLFVFLLFLSLGHHVSPSAIYGTGTSATDVVLTQSDFRHTHIAIASYFGSHYDVHLALAKTLGDVLGPNAHVQEFAFAPFRYGFSDIVESLHLYDQPIQSPRDFLDAVASGSPFVNDPDHPFDMVVLGTCEVDMPQWSDQLLATWDARPADQKFKLVCIVHHEADRKWQSAIPAWASRGALRLLPIGYHVGRAFRTHLKELADNADPALYNAMLEYVDIDVHVPVLDLPEYTERSTATKVSRAAIQGSFSGARRDYVNLFRDLIIELERDAPAWGYRPLSYDRDVFEPLPEGESEAERFKLFLLGYGELEIPKALAHVVEIRTHLNYSDFYALIQTMDVVIPGFSGDAYYEQQASSTIAMAVECNVPILATERIRKAYGYIDDDRVVITRPQGLREVPAIGVLRSGHYSPPSSPSSSSSSSIQMHTESQIYRDRFVPAVEHMLARGWRRAKSEYDDFKRELWRRNRETVKRILADRPGEV